MNMSGMGENFPEYAIPGGRQVPFQPYANNGGSVVAIAGEDYAVIGADSRLSTGHSICTRDQCKLLRMTSKTVFASVGCWSDTLTLSKLLRARVIMYDLDHNKTISTPAFAQMLSTMLYFKRFFPFYQTSVVAGLDETGRGCVYSYDCIGHYERHTYCANGSARAQMLPILDNQIGLKNMKGAVEQPLPVDKALTLLKDAFTSAAERDICTGDSAHIAVITSNGIDNQTFQLRKD